MRIEAVLAAFALVFAALAAPAPAQSQRAEEISVAPGQPLCIDQESLAALIVALVSGDAGKVKVNGGCESIAPASRAVVIERYPGGSTLGRVVKVRVTAPRKPPVTGYTIELIKE
jgi:hypothetical protein